jgi:RND family efflux transporter MFP subunit
LGRTASLVAIATAIATAFGGAVYAKYGLEPQASETPRDLVAAAAPLPARAELTATGYLVPQRISSVAAKTSARVIRVHVAPGDEVHAGDLLIELDGTDDERALVAARAHTASARAHGAVARAQIAESRGVLERERQLAKSGATPRAVVDDLASKLAVLEASARAADADSSARAADAKLIEQGLDNYRVVAPFDGVVLDVPASEGEVVAVGMPLAEIADPASMLVELDIPEAKLALIVKDARCEVVFDALPGQTLAGVVSRAPIRVSRAKATGTAKVRLLDPPTELRPDMAARVRVLSNPPASSELKGESP